MNDFMIIATDIRQIVKNFAFKFENTLKYGINNISMYVIKKILNIYFKYGLSIAMLFCACNIMPFNACFFLFFVGWD